MIPKKPVDKDDHKKYNDNMEATRDGGEFEDLPSENDDIED